ncbi:MAG TPA: hypothetical protein VM536_08700 [Chloroflexia bacterium]|nr:hypothetical protein [Chloroflexia bacterium]
MPTLADELQTHATAILDELMRRAKDELKGTLYEEMNKQKVLRARYTNVLEVLTAYAQDGDLAMFRQHHIIIFMQRYYLDIDAESPLTPRLVSWRTREIERSVNLYREVLKGQTAPEHHAELEATFAAVRELIHQMGQFLLSHMADLQARIPRVKMAGIDYGDGSRFDIDPQHWPEAAPATA